MDAFHKVNALTSDGLTRRRTSPSSRLSAYVPHVPIPNSLRYLTSYKTVSTPPMTVGDAPLLSATAVRAFIQEFRPGGLGGPAI